jgi:branched-chain amino acid aminotransferase
MSNLYSNINGQILSSTESGVGLNNRAYLYGDGLFESVRVYNGKVINFENHYSRLVEGAKAIKMIIPDHYNTAFFLEKIEILLIKSQATAGAKVRVSFDRTSGGRYKPTSNVATYTIDVELLPVGDFELNSKGVEVDIYTDIRKTKNSLNSFKTKNGLIYVLAAIQASEKGMDDMLITNSDLQIIESSSSNLFIVSNGVLYTPGLEEGCLAGTMRMQVINLALKNGIKVYESPILPQNLLSADEVFLTNAISGITWVGGYRTKRYFNNTSRRIVAFLNDYWENQLNPSDEKAPFDE